MPDLPISITFALIALNVVVSVPGFFALRKKRYRPYFLFIPSKAAQGKNWIGMLLSHFSHGDLWHLLVNMIALYLFGPRVEEALGGGPYLIVYAVSGLGATLLVFLIRRKDPRHAALGASGSIAGVLFASVVLVPEATLYVMFLPIEVPAPVFAVLYLLISSFMMDKGGKVSHEAHIGGAITGFVLAGLLSDGGFAPLIRVVTDLLS